MKDDRNRGARTPVRVDAVTTGGLLLIYAAGAALSFSGWYLLALLGGFDWRLAAIVPLATDVFLFIAARAWLRLPWITPKTRKFASTSTLVAATLSVVANATYHLLHNLPTVPPALRDLVAVAVGGLGPFYMAMAAHLQGLLNADAAAINTAPEPAPAPRPRAARPTPAPPLNPPQLPKAPVQRRPARPETISNADRALEIVQARRDITPKDLGAELNLGDRQGRNLLRGALARIAEIESAIGNGNPAGNGNAPGGGNGNERPAIGAPPPSEIGNRGRPAISGPVEGDGNGNGGAA